MSYIRCLSNPEGLYVWSDGKFANITHNVKPPHSSGKDFTIPHRVFERVLKRWADYHQPAKCAGAVAEELSVDRKIGEVIGPFKPCNRGCERQGKAFILCKPCHAKMMKDIRRSSYVIRLSYKGNFVNMWRVTWDYMTKRFRK